MNKMKSNLTILLIIMFSFIVTMSSCSPVSDTQNSFVDPTPSTTFTITPTTDWFPATITPSPQLLPTQIPTSEKKVGLGNILLTDNFIDQSYWSFGQSTNGTIAYGNDQLTLSVSNPKGQLFSYRNDIQLDNFYLEITPQVNLCQGEDNYGILFRTNSEYDYYRLIITCNGLIRLERLNNTKIALLQNFTPSGQVPIGSPVRIKIGIWANESEFRIFVNDIYQFSAQDPVWTTGSLGLFARSAGENALSVSFSDLAIYDLSNGIYNEIDNENLTTITPEANGESG